MNDINEVYSNDIYVSDDKTCNTVASIINGITTFSIDDKEENTCSNEICETASIDLEKCLNGVGCNNLVNNDSSLTVESFNDYMHNDSFYSTCDSNYFSPMTSDKQTPLLNCSNNNNLSSITLNGTLSIEVNESQLESESFLSCCDQSSTCANSISSNPVLCNLANSLLDFTCGTEINILSSELQSTNNVTQNFSNCLEVNKLEDELSSSIKIMTLENKPEICEADSTFICSQGENNLNRTIVDSDSNLVTATEGSSSLSSPSYGSSSENFHNIENVVSVDNDSVFAGEKVTSNIIKKELTESIPQNMDLEEIDFSEDLKKSLDGENHSAALLEAWKELRSSIRHMVASFIPLNKANAKQRPSINRIKALTNMLILYDVHGLFLRLNQSAHEMCIELKVRLLSTISDIPLLEEAISFINGLCEAYGKVISVCDALQPAFERLDLEHLSKFNINMQTVYMHTFYLTIFVDSDVKEYIDLCFEKLKGSEDEVNMLGCINSLKRALTTAESVWLKSEGAVHEFTVQKALSSHCQNILDNWDKVRLSQNLSTPYLETGNQKRINDRVSSSSVVKTCSENTGEKILPHGCECHYCHSSTNSSVSNGVLLGNHSAYFPPNTAPPQLSLYPHIHGMYSAGEPHSGHDSLFSSSYMGKTSDFRRQWGDTLLYSASSMNSCSHTHSLQNDSPNNLTRNLGSLGMIQTNTSCSNISPVSSHPQDTLLSHSLTGPYISTSVASACSHHSSDLAHTSVITHTSTYHVQPEKTSSSVSSGHDEWSSGEETDSSTTSPNRHAPHCDCCYYHFLHNKQNGIRHKFSEHKERIKKRNLSRKKKLFLKNDVERLSDVSDTCMPRRKLRKANRRSENRDASEYEEKDMAVLEVNEDDEEDGPLAELRRRAPDVTITVVKPGQQTTSNTDLPQKNAKSSFIAKNSLCSENKTPIQEFPLQTSLSSSSGMFGNYHSRTAPVQHPLLQSNASSEEAGRNPFANKLTNDSSGSAGLSNLLKGIENLGSEKDKGSQMVTIRRVMDPASSEPTVTITLKGEQPEKDKVLFKLVNGQAIPGNAKNNIKPDKSAAMCFDIPDGLDPEEVKLLKKKQKKERQRLKRHQNKEMEKSGMDPLSVHHQQQYQLQQQQELLRQQEEQIKQQQMIVQKKQDELRKQQESQKSSDSKRRRRRNRKHNVDSEDMARSYNLPPGVSINKVAGQPGMVTISNNMGGAFPQPFLPNPNPYAPSMMNFSNSISPSGLSNFHSGFFGGCQPPALNGASTFDPYDQEGVIVVDTKSQGRTSCCKDDKPSKRSMDIKKVKSIESKKVKSEDCKKVKSAVEINKAAKSTLDNKKMKSDDCKKGKGLVENKLKSVAEYKKCTSITDRKMLKSIEEKKKISTKDTSVRNTTSNQINSSTKKSAKNDGKQVKREEIVCGEAVSAAIKGEVDPDTLTKTQRKKYRKLKKALGEEDCEEQREEDELMDYMYNLAKGDYSCIVVDDPENGVSNDETPKGDKSSKLKTSAKPNANSVSYEQQKMKNKNQKGDPSKKKMVNDSVQKDNLKTQSNSLKTRNVISKDKVQEAENMNKTKNIPQKTISNQPSKVAENRKGKFSDLRSNKSGLQKTTSGAALEKQKPVPFGCENMKGSSSQYQRSGNHDARYAQYVAANAKTLASINNRSEGSHNTDRRKLKGRSGKGTLDDPIESVFTPKDMPEGELDETERDVEAFKRFCFNNVPRHGGEKLKVNLNVKDIMLKRKS